LSVQRMNSGGDEDAWRPERRSWLGATREGESCVGESKKGVPAATRPKQTEPSCDGCCPQASRHRHKRTTAGNAGHPRVPTVASLDARMTVLTTHCGEGRNRTRAAASTSCAAAAAGHPRLTGAMRLQSLGGDGSWRRRSEMTGRVGRAQRRHDHLAGGGHLRPRRLQTPSPAHQER